jgi:hypothetical protein
MPSPFGQLDRFILVRCPFVLLALLVVGCTQAQPVASTTPHPTPTPVTSSCRLPISIADAQGSGQGAFVTVPGAQVTSDASGAGGVYYDRAFSRWLPVSWNAVSPNGATYVRLEPKVPGKPGRTRLHLVNVSTGGDQLYELGSADDLSAYVVVAYGPEGIWLTYAGYEGPSHGLFRADLVTGGLTDMSGGREFFDPIAGGAGVVWFTDGGPNPKASPIGFPIPARISRLTLADGRSVPWFTKDGSGLRVFGTDLAGHPIFGISSNQVSGFDVWIASAPGEASMMALPAGFYQVFADGHGVWFGGDQGLYLYSDTGAQKVSAQKGAPAGSCA